MIGYFESQHSGLILCLSQANEKRRNFVTQSLIGWAQNSNSMFNPSQWETALLCNEVSHWLGAKLEISPDWIHSTDNIPFNKTKIILSPVNSPQKGQWRGALVFFFIYAYINSWVNNREAGDLRRHRAHYDAIIMICHQNEPSLVLIMDRFPFGVNPLSKSHYRKQC